VRPSVFIISFVIADALIFKNVSGTFRSMDVSTPIVAVLSAVAVLGD
jgi:hypothetical protein